MTRSNIDEHLAWLLRSAAVLSVPFTSSPAATQQPGSSTDDLPIRSVQAGPACFSNSQNAIAAENALNNNSLPAFAVPSIPASVLNGRNKEEMARLQTGSASSHKPRLLSERAPSSLTTPTHHGSRTSGLSLTERYTSQFEQTRTG